MGDLLNKLDEIMTSDRVRKLGGLFCLVTIVILAVAFIIGAGSMLKSAKGPVADAEVTEEEGAAEEATDEDNEEEDEAEEEAEE
jgi:beta-lactam-binding protein with PASTA domain